MHTFVFSPVASVVRMKCFSASLPSLSPHVSLRSCAASFSNSSVVIDGFGVAVLVGGGGGDDGGGGDCAAGGAVVLPLSRSYTQVVNHCRPILRFVPALTSDAR